MEITESKIQEENYRFLQDLEFVQCLSNPGYLECKFPIIIFLQSSHQTDISKISHSLTT